MTLVDRRGKYLIVRFESGRALLIHLRMTGSLLHAAAGTLPDDPHRRAVVKLDDGSDVAYRDVRRFGTWLLLEPAEVDDVPRRARRARAARGRVQGEAPRRAARGPARADQGGDPRPAHGRRRREHLRRRGALARAASIRSRRPPSSTPDEVKARPHAASAPRCRRASAGRARRCATTGCPTASSGSAQHEFKVYGRGGEPCERCGTPIDKIRVAGRGTWYCPSCQRLPRRLRREQLVEPALAVEAPELGVAADRRGRRSGSAAPSSRRSARAASRGSRRRRRGGSPRTRARARRAAPSRGRSSRTSASYTS